MKTTRAAVIGIAAAIAGGAVVFLVVVIGSLIGGLIEARIGSPVVSWEMAPFVVWFFATPGGVLVAVIGALTGRWWSGLAIGLLIHGMCFGFLLLSNPSNPFAVSCWAFIVGTIAGGAAGAMGGAVRQLKAKDNCLLSVLNRR